MSVRAYLARYADSTSVRLAGPFCQPGCALPEPVIFVDRGAACRRAREGFSVGDGDSHPGPLDERLDPDKDYSDLAYVLGNLPNHFREVHLLGFLGGRRDHELFNLGEVHHFLLTRRQPARALFDRQIEAFSRGEWLYEQQGIFSIAVLARTRVRLDGDCQYRLVPPQILQPLSSRGLSNRAWGSVSLLCDGPVFLFRGG